MAYTFPPEVTIPFLDVTISLSTLIGLVLLLVLFFSFFSVSISVGGSLSPKDVAVENNPCETNPDSNSYDYSDMMSSIGQGMESAAFDAEQVVAGGLQDLLDDMENNTTGTWGAA